MRWYAWDVLTKNCVVGQRGFHEGAPIGRRKSVDTGDIEKDKKPSFEQIVEMSLATEAVNLAGGRVTIGKCTE